MFDVRHRFDPARDDKVGHAGLDHHRGVDDRLHPRSAAPVELISRYVERQPRRQPRPMADSGGLGLAIALPAPDLADAPRDTPGPPSALRKASGRRALWQYDITTVDALHQTTNHTPASATPY